jgi:hypothetical protein
MDVKQFLALVGVRTENYMEKIIGRKRTIELHHEVLRDL